MADGFLLDVDTSKLREADNYFKSMISNAEKLQTALKGALGDPKAFAAVNILERVKPFMTEIGDTRLSPNIDTKRLEEFSSEMSNIVEMMQLMSQQKGIQFFDTKSVRDMEGNAIRIQKNIDAIDSEIKQKQKQYNNIQFKAPINPRTGNFFGKKTKAYATAVLAYGEEQDAVWREIKALEEKKKGYQEDLRLAKMTEDEKLQYVMKNIAKESAEKQKEINAQRARYKTLLSEQLDIQKKLEQAGKYGDLGEEGQKTIDEYNRQFEIRDKERRKIEEDYAVFVVDLTENAQRKMLDANLKRIKQEQEAQQLAYRTSAQGALEYAGKASTINEMKDAQKYLQIARGNVNVADTDTIKKLNDEYTRLRATIEALTTAEKNEQSLQPSLRNEYIRLRKELDANREAQEKFAKLKDGNPDDIESLVAREQDLQNKILSIKQNAGALLDETDRQYEAEKSKRAVELAEKTEAQKAEIAKRKAREAYEEYKKTGVLSVDKAERLIGLTDNAKNAAQAEKAIKSLENAKKRLDKTDSRYEITIKDLNKAIAKHKQTIEQTKPVVEAVARVSAADALSNAKNARTLQDLRQALKDLKQSREELDIENDSYTIKDISNAINDVNDKISELEGKQKEVKQNNNDLKASFAGLKRLAIAWIGIEALKNYARKVVETRREFELLQKSLQTLLQDKNEANKIWRQTLDLALVSPFSVKELIGYTRQLAAYRIETELLHDRTKRLADVSAGLGVDMSRLILAYGQVRAASFLRATELRQFTEAGIPMLDELSKKLSDVEGRFISVGDVMEMISKRKVSFEDVDETFISMTSQGGMFYKMQEKQADTMHGLISNMKDAFDLMFNEIGKGQDGLIKGFLKGITNIVKEWRKFAAEFTGLATGVVVGKLAASCVRIGKSIWDWYKGAKSVGVAFKSISATGWGAIIGALASIAVYFWQINQEADELKQKFDEINAEQSKDLKESIDKYKELASAVRSATSSYTERNEALKELNRLYGNILPNEYLEIENIKKMSNGYQEASDALKEYYNAKTREQKQDLIESKFNEKYQSAVSSAYKSLQGFIDMPFSVGETFNELFGADENTVRGIIAKTIEDAKEGKVAIEDFYSTVIKRTEVFYGKVGRLNELVMRGGVLGGLSSAPTNLLRERETAMLNITGLPFETQQQQDAYNKQQQLIKLFEEQASVVKELNNNITTLYDNQGNMEYENIVKLKNAISNLYEKLGVEMPVNLFTDIQNSALDATQEVQRVNVEVRKLFIENNSANYGEDIIKKFFEDIDKDIAKIRGGRLRNVVESLMREVATETNLKIFDKFLIDDKQSLSDYRKIIVEEYDRMKAAVDAYKTALAEAGESIVQREMVNNIHNKELMEQYEKALPILLKYKNLLGGDVKKQKTGGRSNSLYDERIKVIDDMSKKYEELRKVFSEDEARTGAFEAYKDAFAKAYKGIKWVDKNVKQMTPEEFMQKVLNFPDKNKIVEFLDRLAKEPKKAFEQIKVELAKGEYVHEMKLEAKLESDKDLTKKIEAMFKDYELSLDVQKMGLSAFDAKDMFNLDVLNLEQLKQQLRDAHSEFIGKDKEEEYKEFFARIYELEEEQRIEQMKKYSKYLADSMTERVKLKKEELAQLAELEKLNFTDEQKALIRNSIQQESQAQMNKLDWEEFKNSDMYIRIFQDIDGASTKTLQHMRAKLAEMKSQLKNLDPKEVKAIVSEMEKIDEALAKKNPFKTAITGLDDYIKAVKKAKEIEKEYLEGQQKEDDLEKQENLVSNMLGAEQANLKKMNERGDATELDISLQQNKIKQLQQQLLLLQQQLKKQKEINEANGQAVQQNEETKKKFTDSLKDVGAQISSAASALPQVAADLEHVFGAMDAGTKDTVESISEIGGGIGNAITGFASGNYIQGITGVTQAIAGIFNIGDKKKERAIQRELKRVEELQKEYEKLDEKIQTMYNIDDINVNYNAMKKNLNEQIASTEKMIQLENDKKKTDHARIAEYREQIEEYKKQLEELEDARIRQLGGIAGGDAIYSTSQSFVDAWIDAFRETGDGLSGLEEQFDEVYMNLVKKQVLGRGVDKMLEPLYSKLNGMLDDGAMTAQEFEDFTSTWDGLSPQISEFLTNVANDLGIADDITRKNGELSGLQEGISGITEDQADILAAYWSSVRFIVSNIEQKFTEYARQMLGTDLSANPILNELKAQTSLLDEINDKLGSVIGHSGGAHIKTNLIS